jgi:hypothetical protein
VRITKVVVFFTTNPTKLVLQFSEFSTIFYVIYKNQQNCNTIEDVVLRRGPCNFSKSHTSALRSHKTPRKDLGACNGVPGRGRPRARQNSGSSGGSPGGGTMVGCAHAHLGPGCSWSWGGKLAGVGNRRRPAAVTAAARAPARLRLGVDNK